MKPAALAFINALFALAALKAQPSISAFDLRPVIQPGMTIDGHTFAKDTRVYHAALNDAGDMVFSVRFDDGTGPVAIFTSRDMIVRERDVIDGKVIVLIDPDAPIAINNNGQVGWIAWYADKKEMSAGKESWLRAIFVDRHLTLNLFTESNEPFKLTDDGRVERLYETEERPAPQPVPAEKKRRLLGGLTITGPKLPGGASVGVGSDRRNTPAPLPGLRSRPSLAEDPLPGLPGNRAGQKLLAVNYPNGFLLILATPIKH